MHEDVGDVALVDRAEFWTANDAAIVEAIYLAVLHFAAVDTHGRSTVVDEEESRDTVYQQNPDAAVQSRVGDVPCAAVGVWQRVDEKEILRYVGLMDVVFDERLEVFELRRVDVESLRHRLHEVPFPRCQETIGADVFHQLYQHVNLFPVVQLLVD